MVTKSLRVTARSSFTLPDTGSYTLLFESETFAGNCRLFLNGAELPPPYRTRVYDAWNYAVDISQFVRAGENILQVEWDAANEDDGITSMVYILAE